MLYGESTLCRKWKAPDKKKKNGREKRWRLSTKEEHERLPVLVSPGWSTSRLWSPRLDLLRGFVNEMDILALCPYITQLGFHMSSFPSLLFFPLPLLFINRLPRLQHGGVQLPSLTNSLESASSSLSLWMLLSLISIHTSYKITLLLSFSNIIFPLHE